MFKKIIISISALALSMTLVASTFTPGSFINNSVVASAQNTPAATTGLPQGYPTQQEICGSRCALVANPLNTVSGNSRQTIFAFIISIARLLTFLAAAIAIVFLIYGGYQYITDDGSEANAKKGKLIITNAVIGLAIAILAYTIVGLVLGLLAGDIGLLTK